MLGQLSCLPEEACSVTYTYRKLMYYVSFKDHSKHDHLLMEDQAVWKNN